MALTVPDVCRFTIIGRWTNGHTVATVLDYQIDTTGATISRTDAIIEAAQDIIQNWQSQVMPELANNYTVEQIAFLDLNTEDGIASFVGPDSGEVLVGGIAAGTVTPNVSVLVKKATIGARGKRSGRMYLPAPPESYVNEDGELTPESIAAYQAALDDFLANTNQTDPDPGDASRKMVVSHLGEKPAPGEEDNRVGTYTDVEALVVQSIAATQRRRLR